MQHYNQYEIYQNMDKFSEIAEKNIVISSSIIQKNKIEEEQRLKEKEELLQEMKNKMNNNNINNSTSQISHNNIPNYNQNFSNSNNPPLLNFSQISRVNNNINGSQIYNNYNYNNNIQNQNQSINQSQLSMSNMSVHSSQHLNPSQFPSLSNMSINSSQHYMGGNNISQINQTQIGLSLRQSKSQEINYNFPMVNQHIYNSGLINYNPPKETYNILSSKEIISKSNPLINNKLYLKIKEEQDKKNLLYKNKIIQMHGKTLTNYYEYSIEERDKHLDNLLEDMNYFGEIMKNEITKDKKLIANYYSINDALEFGHNKKKKTEYKNEYFVLALLANALKFQGCDVLIERDYAKKEDKINELNTTIQFLANGMYNFKKYIFYFDFGEENNYKLLTDLKEQNSLNKKLKLKLLYLFKLREKDIIMTNPNYAFSNTSPLHIIYSITSIIKQSKFNELSMMELLQLLKREQSFFNKIIDIKKNILLSGCKLNIYMLDSRGNNKDGGWGFNEIRGGAPYYPPNGWVGYGLRIADRYDNGDNSWIDYNNSKGEWSVAYHGIGSGLKGTQIFNSGLIMNSLIQGINQQFKNMKDLFHLGQTVGEGMIVTPKPEIMEQSCGIFDCYGKKYKIGFMSRVMPKKIRCPEGQDNYWIIQGTDNEIRPYRILIKEL